MDHETTKQGQLSRLQRFKNSRNLRKGAFLVLLVAAIGSGTFVFALWLFNGVLCCYTFACFLAFLLCWLSAWGIIGGSILVFSFPLSDLDLHRGMRPYMDDLQVRKTVELARSGWVHVDRDPRHR